MIRKIVTPSMALYVLPCILLWQIFIGLCLLPANLLRDIYPWRTSDQRDLVPWNVLQFDGITQFYPWRLFASQTWRSGYVPLWNPYQFCGSPFLANSQSAVLYPPNLLFEVMPVKFAFGWSALLHLIFTGVMAYLFFRRASGCSRWGATIGATCWQLSTWQISWLALPTFLDTSSWLPAALLCVHSVAARPTVPRAAALAATIAMMVLGGHLQIAFYCLLLTVSYALLQIVQQRVRAVHALRVATTAATVAVLLMAAQLLPTVELSRQSTRTGASPSAAGYLGYVALAMPAEQLTAFIVPGFFGHPGKGTYWGATNYAENAGYVGVIGLFLAVVGLIRKRPNVVQLFFAAFATLSLLIAIGTPLNMLLYYGIPGFSATGSPARILVLWSFCAAVLAAYGVDELLSQPKSSRLATAVFAAIGVAVVGGTCFALLHQNNGYSANIQAASDDLRVAAGLGLIAAAIVYLLSQTTITPAIAAPLLFAATATDLLFVNFGYNPIVPQAAVYPVTPAISWLQRNVGISRIMPLNRQWSIVDPPNAVLPPNGATVYGLYDVQGYDSLQTRSYKEFTNELDGGVDSSPPENGNMDFTNGVDAPDSELAGARYLVNLGPLEGMRSPQFIDGQTYIYEDRSARPLAGASKVLSSAATRVTFQTNGPLDAAIQWYPGWKAFGGPRRHTPLVCEQGAKPSSSSAQPPLIHVEVYGPGIVDLRFQPESFQVGLYLSLLGLLLVSSASSAAFSVRKMNG